MTWRFVGIGDRYAIRNEIANLLTDLGFEDVVTGGYYVTCKFMDGVSRPRVGFYVSSVDGGGVELHFIIASSHSSGSNPSGVVKVSEPDGYFKHIVGGTPGVNLYDISVSRYRTCDVLVAVVKSVDTGDPVGYIVSGLDRTYFVDANGYYSAAMYGIGAAGYDDNKTIVAPEYCVSGGTIKGVITDTYGSSFAWSQYYTFAVIIGGSRYITVRGVYTKE